MPKKDLEKSLEKVRKVVLQLKRKKGIHYERWKRGMELAKQREKK